MSSAFSNAARQLESIRIRAQLRRCAHSSLFERKLRYAHFGAWTACLSRLRVTSGRHGAGLFSRRARSVAGVE